MNPQTFARVYMSTVFGIIAVGVMGDLFNAQELRTMAAYMAVTALTVAAITLAALAVAGMLVGVWSVFFGLPKKIDRFFNGVWEDEAANA
jgi:hypothetical protein